MLRQFVIYTDSAHTIKYIEGLVKRIESGDYKMLVRKLLC